MKRSNAHEVTLRADIVSCVYVYALQCVCAKGKRASHKLYYQRM